MTARPPLCDAQHRERLFAVARGWLAEREARYPALVDAGQLKASDAADGLERARCLVAQWRWIMDPARPALPGFDWITAGHFGAPAGAIAADLHTASERARAIAERPDAKPADAVRADALAALAWLQQQDRILTHIVVEQERERLPDVHPERIAA